MFIFWTCPLGVLQHHLVVKCIHRLMYFLKHCPVLTDFELYYYSVQNKRKPFNFNYSDLFLVSKSIIILVTGT